jgi:hypothetical protein
LSSIPTINSSSFDFSINNNSFTSVSGIDVVYTNPTFTVNTKITNLFKNFFKSDLLSYTFGNGGTGIINETNLTNCTTNPIPKDGSTVDFTNNSATATLNDVFNKSISLTVTARNFKGDNTFTPIAINVICDKPSYNLINSPTKNPAIINSVTTTETAGYRVWSAPGTPPSTSTYMPPMYGYNNDTISYTKFKYDHTWNLKISTTNSITINGTTYNNIDATQELQIFNGYYQSIGSGSYKNNNINNENVVGYTDYSTYKNNNTLDYSVAGLTDDITSNYRFATFVWKYENEATPNYFIFTLKNFKYNGITPAIDDDGVSYLVSSGNSRAKNRIFLHYRVEQYDNTTIYVNPISSKSSTIWVDGNSKKGTISGSLGADINNPASISSDNYYNDVGKTVVRAPGSISYSMSGNDLVATVSSILFGKSSDTGYIYCRIGLPMNANYAFEYVTLKI